jgi:hypothetical protein
MATHCHIQELTRGLRIQAREDLPRWERLLVAAVVGMFVAILGGSFAGGWWSTTLSIVVSVATYGAVRSKRAELQVTKVEFITKGYLGRRVRTHG